MSHDADTQSTGHALNRHLFIVDNYHLLRSLDTGIIDLICTDPPFAKNDTFIGELKPPLTDDEAQQEEEQLKDWGISNPSQAERNHVTWPTGATTAKFKDIWSWEKDVHEQWMDEIKTSRPDVLKVIETTRYTHGEGTAAYLAYMAVRLIECHRVLKPTGSLFLHCDGTANSHLRMLLDAIFDHRHLRNEIVWCYKSGGASPRKYFSRKHDTIYWYSKSKDCTFNPQQEKSYNRGFKPYRFKGVKEYQDEVGWYTLVGMKDYWHIDMIGRTSKERTGYPTQKPIALAERILKAASNPGDLVLDPFAGCAYVPVAAERLHRQWVACDISPRALTVLRRQFKKFAYSVDGELSEGEMLSVADVTLRGPSQLPVRTTADDDAPPVKPLPQRRYKVSASIFSREEMLEFLLDLSEWRAWCCGFANWKVGADGVPAVERTIRNFELDHIDPKPEDGRHEIDNRAPLCPYHNSTKSDRRVRLDELRQEVAEAGEMLVSSVDDLVDLPWARDQVMDHWASGKARRSGLTLPGIG